MVFFGREIVVRSRVWSDGLCALVGLALCATACLPKGDPPSGRQVIADRTTVLAGILPASSDGIVRLLVVRLHPDHVAGDLYAVSVGAAGAPQSERLLLENVTWGYGCNLGFNCFVTDARG